MDGKQLKSLFSPVRQRICVFLAEHGYIQQKSLSTFTKRGHAVITDFAKRTGDIINEISLWIDRKDVNTAEGLEFKLLMDVRTAHLAADELFAKDLFVEHFGPVHADAGPCLYHCEHSIDVFLPDGEPYPWVLSEATDYAALGEQVCDLLEKTVLPELKHRETDEGLYQFLKETLYSHPERRTCGMDMQAEMCLVWLAQKAGDEQTVRDVLGYIASGIHPRPEVHEALTGTIGYPMGLMVTDDQSPYQTFRKGMAKIGIDVDGLDYWEPPPLPPGFAASGGVITLDLRKKKD